MLQYHEFSLIHVKAVQDMEVFLVALMCERDSLDVCVGGVVWAESVLPADQL